MAEEVLDKLRDLVDGFIVRYPVDALRKSGPVVSDQLTGGHVKDFEGQRRAEWLATLMLAVSGLLAFNVGYLYQDTVKAIYIGMGGTALTFFLVVPPWPYFSRSPVKWLPAGSGWD